MTNTNREANGVSPYEVERFFADNAGGGGHSRGHTVGERLPQVGFKRLTPGAILPTKAHDSDSGYDLCAAEDVIIAPGETVVIPTGIAVKLPPGFEATVRPRSGVTSKTKLRVQLGTVDQPYIGEIGVIVDNIAQTNDGKNYGFDLLGGGICREFGPTFPDKTYKIFAGERIAQLVITRLPELEAVEIDDLGESERGSSGFGSTGV